jgi:hypothetical protein
VPEDRAEGFLIVVLAFGDVRDVEGADPDLAHRPEVLARRFGRFGRAVRHERNRIENSVGDAFNPDDPPATIDVMHEGAVDPHIPHVGQGGAE